MTLRDPYYAAIEQALGRPGIDTDAFERMAAELVEEKHHPTNLVSGGSDDGYDFELLDPTRKHEPGPGVATTSERVLDNLRRNLTRNKQNRPRADKRTYLVTSRPITPQKRRNLFECARKLGYILLGIADREEVARFLYTHSDWARELLQLDGRPAALSPVPSTPDRTYDLPLVGRDEVVRTLRDGIRDMMLIGGPGSGKTAVLMQLAREDLGAFLADPDPGAITNAIRSQKPVAVFVDDAPFFPDIREAVRALARLRHMLGSTFRIIATSWQRDADVEQCLGVPLVDVVELERLTRGEMVEVVKSAGVIGPAPLVREILDQAEGVPGLAVYLTQAALGGQLTSLVQGDLLGSLMTSSVIRLLGRGADGQQAVHVLAAAALAGDDGLTAAEIAMALQLSPSHVSAVLRTLEPAGVIVPQRDRVQVRPRPLRSYLIREAFFATAPLDFCPVLRQAPDHGRAVVELIRAHAAGATVPDLLQLVLGSNSETVARHYAGVGSGEARQLLKAQPSLAVPVAWEALHTAPDAVLPLLLAGAVGDERALHSSPEHPLRKIKDWAQAGMPGTGEGLRRRRAVVEAAVKWTQGGGNGPVAIRACSEVMPPVYESGEMDPGEGIKYTITRGTLSADEIAELEGLWLQLLPLIEAEPSAPWQSLLHMAHQVAHPMLSGVPEKVTGATRALARRVIADLGALAPAHPGVLDRLNRLRASIGDEGRFAIPNDYLVLFGDFDWGDWEVAEKRRAESLGELVESWKGRPEHSAERLAHLRSEAALIDNHVDHALALCSQLAALVDEPEVWLSAFVERHLGSYIEPFLDRVVSEDSSAAGKWTESLLGTDAEGAVLSVVLRSASVSDVLWLQVAPRLSDWNQLVNILCLRKQVPQANLDRLLRHDSEAVRAATAVGIWQGREHGAIPEALRPAWSSAVVSSVSDDYWLREMLPSDSGIAEAWIAERIDRRDWRAFSERANVDAAVSVLSNEQRVGLLRRIPDGFVEPELVQSVVGGSVDIYSAALQDPALRDLCGHPLERPADGTWRLLTEAALRHGTTEEQIVACSTWRWGVFAGPESARLQSQISEFEPWLTDEHPGIRSVAEKAIRALGARRARALADERREAVEGF